MEHMENSQKVIMHMQENKWYVVRPFDHMQAEIGFANPCLEIFQQQTAKGCVNRVIVDSAERDPNVKPVYADKILKQRGVAAVGAAFVKCEMFLFCKYELRVCVCVLLGISVINNCY